MAKRCFVVGDIHGRIHSLEKLLQKAGVINKKGKRITTDQVVSLGDLANAVMKDLQGDEECLKIAPEWFDVLLMGNHESGYVIQGGGFGGYWEAPHLKSLYNSYVRSGFVQLAMAIDNTLISHAGLAREFDFKSAQEAMEEIEFIWEHHNEVEDKQSHLLRGCGRARGGYLPYGGILWSDWRFEPKNQNFNQVVGHTTVGPDRQDFDNGNWALNIDSDVRRGERVTGVWLDEQGQIEELVIAKLGVDLPEQIAVALG